MASARTTTRWDAIPAYVLHTYPYKETSLIVEAFTPTLGRVALIAKGAKRPGSAVRALLQPFLALRLSFSGKSEVKTLTAAEWQAGHALLPTRATMVAYYMNELVLKLLPRDDVHAALFEHYEKTLARITGDADTNAALREFELHLLSALGYGLNLDTDAETDRPISANECYRWLPEHGFFSEPRSTGFRIAGDVVLALRNATWNNALQMAEAKRFMRHVLDFHLERRSLASRRLAYDVQALLESAP